jgi:hypothetical protein
MRTQLKRTELVALDPLIPAAEPCYRPGIADRVEPP